MNSGRQGKMATERHFCSSCGKPVEPGDKFCGSCGGTLKVTAAPLASTIPAAPQATPAPHSAPQPAAAPPVNTGEAVIGVIPASRKSGMFSQEGLHIVVTEKRLICAVFTNEMIKQAAKEEGKSGFLSGMIGAATVGYTYYKRYLSMAPEAALKENAQNFAVGKESIQKIKLVLGKRQTDRNRHVDVYEPSKLEIESSGGKYSWTVPNNFHEMASTALRQAGLI
jgi:hypothetical protein